MSEQTYKDSFLYILTVRVWPGWLAVLILTLILGLLHKGDMELSEPKARAWAASATPCELAYIENEPIRVLSKNFLDEAENYCERLEVRRNLISLPDKEESAARIVQPKARIIDPSDSERLRFQQDFKDALGSSALNEGIDLGFPQGDGNVPMGGMPVIDLGTMQNSK